MAKIEFDYDFEKLEIFLQFVEITFYIHFQFHNVFLV